MKTLFYDNRRLLVLAITIILISGASAFFSLPRAEDPRFKNRFGVILTQYPGAPAERVETLVTKKIEQKLREISEVSEISSSSNIGFSQVKVRIEDSIQDVASVWARIRKKVTDVESLLPLEASKPEFDETRNGVAASLLLALAWDFDSEPNFAILNRVASELTDRLTNIPGSEFVTIYGAPEEEILVSFAPEKLAFLKLTIAEVAQIIQQADTKKTAGSLRTSEKNLVLEVRGELASLERISQIPILQKENEIIRLSHIAKISKSFRSPEKEIILIDGKPVIIISSKLEGGVNLEHWHQEVVEVIENFKKEVTKGVRIFETYNQLKYTKSRFNDLTKSLFLGFLIIELVIFFMMGWRSALLVGSALPLSCCCVLFGFKIFGVRLHQMSVTGFILSLGLLIDNAIVMVDATNYYLQEEKLSPKETISKSLSIFFLPLLGSTLTTIIAFMPLLLLVGAAGDFVGSIAISVSLALTSSFFIAMTLIPALTCLFQKPYSTKKKKRFWRNGFRSKFLNWLFTKSIKFVVYIPLVGIAFSLCLPLVGFVRKQELKDQFFPTAERDQFYFEFLLQNETPIQKTIQISKEMEARIRSFPGVKETHWYIGRSAPSFYYNKFSNKYDKSNYGECVILTNTISEVDTIIPKLQKILDKEFPEAQLIFRKLGQGPPVFAPIEIKLFGPSLATLQELGEKVRLELIEMKEILQTQSSFGGSSPKLFLHPNEDKAKLLGLSLSNITSQFQNNFEGIFTSSFVEGTEEIPIRIRLADKERNQMDHLYSFNIISPKNKKWIPLMTLGKLELRPVSTNIERFDGERVNIIRGYIPIDLLPSEVLATFLKKLEKANFKIPLGYRLDIGGEKEEKQKTVKSLFAYVGILMVMMVATLVLSLDSFLLAGLIGITAILSVGLSFFSSWISGYPFGFMSLVGTAGLIGVAINDSIVVLAGIVENPKARNGEKEAIIQEVVHASRHIFSTTFTTIGGFIPLILSGGGFWPPLAIVIAGGVGGATILALYFIPSAYILLLQCGLIKKEELKAIS